MHKPPLHSIVYSKRERESAQCRTNMPTGNLHHTCAPPEWWCHSRTPTRDRSTTPCSPIHPQTPRHTSTLPTARAGSSTVAVHPRVPNPSLLLLHLRTSICPGRVSTRRGRICGGTGGIADAAAGGWQHGAAQFRRERRSKRRVPAREAPRKCLGRGSEVCDGGVCRRCVGKAAARKCLGRGSRTQSPPEFCWPILRLRACG